MDEKPNLVAGLKDQVSPYKITLLVAIEQYCLLANDQQNELAAQMSEQQHRKFLLLLLKLLQSADIELRELILKLSDVVSTKLFTVKLDDLNCDKDALMNLMITLPKTLFGEDDDRAGHSEPLLERSSVLGLYTRRVLLAFNKLNFSHVTKIQQQYKLYYQTWKKSGKMETDVSIGGELSDSFDPFPVYNESRSFGQCDKSELWDDSLPQYLHSDSMCQQKRADESESLNKYSQRQAEFFIAQQANLLSHNEVEALSPKELQEKITRVLSSNPDMAEAHFLSYMNHLRVGEYCVTMENLFQYFDRQQTVGKQQTAAGSKAKVEEESPSRGVRYAALNLAAFQYRFGHRAEALAAVQEAIRMAQEWNDNICLQHALGWLQRLGVQQTGASAYLLDRLVTKSTELNLPYLTSLGIQSFTKHNALATAKPASVFEFIVKSDIVNCQHSLSSLMCNSYAQKAALWQMYGKREMCLLNCQLMLNLNSSEVGVYHNAEAECLALCHLCTLHAQQGEYEVAMEILETTRCRFPPHSQFCSLWMQCEQELFFYRADHQGNWHEAQQAIDNLKNVNSMEAKLCQCILHKDKGDTAAAATCIQNLLKECHCEDGQGLDQPQLYVRLLMVQSELLCSTGNQTEAAAPLLQCITVCKQHHYTHLATMATLHLAYVQYCLGMSEQAVSLVESVLLYIQSHGSVYDRARALYLWVRCTVSASRNQPTDLRHKSLRHCVQKLTDVATLFKQVEASLRVKDVLYLQARLYHALGYVKERNKCALEFKQLDQVSPTFHSTTVCVL